jgi:uncharacterized protein (UPF0276 family)
MLKFRELPVKFLLVSRVNTPLLLDIIKVNVNSQDHCFSGKSHLDAEVRGAK